MEEHSFGTWLRRRRKALDLTQDGLADRVGCSVAMIRKIESEERRPSAQIIERLAEILNISEDERTGFLRFARGDWHSSPIANKGDIPWKVPEKPSHSNVPATATSLIGRQRELTLIQEYLLNNEIRLVTLIGPPGIGKTRLSIEAARTTFPHFQDGVFFVSLAPLEDPTLLAITIAQALGFTGIGNFSTAEQLIEGIGKKQMLLVLDNCEHLIEQVASLISDFLSACSSLKILATSRESLRVSGEWLYPVPTFDTPTETSAIDVEMAANFPALMLFAERARAVQPDFMLDSKNIQTVSAICTHLDGLPLAIELIAPRIRVMSLEDLLARLKDQFLLFGGDIRAASARQQTLQNAISWSYNLLSAEEQNLFSLLSVFSGDFTLSATEAIFSRNMSERSVADLITSLLDKSLLSRTSTFHEEPRFSMLMTIQQFALHQLRRMSSEVDARNQHLAYFLALARKADHELRGPNQIEWLSRMNAISDNLRTSLDWAIESHQTQVALEMARKLHWYWFIRGDHTEGRQWLYRVLEMADTSRYPNARMEALTQLANHIVLQIGENEARPLVEQALELARSHGNKHNLARALLILGLVLINETDFAAAQSTLRESITLFEEVFDEWGASNALMCLSWCFLLNEDVGTALPLNQQALAGFQKLGDRYFQCVVLRHYGLASLKLGNLITAVAVLKESLTLAQQFNSRYEIAWTLWRFAQAVLHANQMANAVSLFWAARHMLDLSGAWQQEHVLEFENELASCRAVLNETEFMKAVERGSTMTVDQAIEYALQFSTGLGG
jgi:predicted ATPase/DNA-binding XRE family transcriptional regulator